MQISKHLFIQAEHLNAYIYSFIYIYIYIHTQESKQLILDNKMMHNNIQ